jgi:D-tyrosyl-tRNA(Tyr) deacylase
VDKIYSNSLVIFKINIVRALIQRVKNASVEIDSKIKSSIRNGLLIFVGIEDNDTNEDIDWLTSKISKLRIFNDENQIMNLSVQEIKGEILVISQFTLHASTKKGNRPSYIKAAKPDHAIPLYNSFLDAMKINSEVTVLSGEFGADMKISLLNDGPVTIFIDSKNKE